MQLSKMFSCHKHSVVNEAEVTKGDNAKLGPALASAGHNAKPTHGALLSRAGLKPMQLMQLHWVPRQGVWVDCSFSPDTPSD